LVSVAPRTLGKNRRDRVPPATHLIRLRRINACKSDFRGADDDGVAVHDARDAKNLVSSLRRKNKKALLVPDGLLFGSSTAPVGIYERAEMHSRGTGRGCRAGLMQQKSLLRTECFGIGGGCEGFKVRSTVRVRGQRSLMSSILSNIPLRASARPGRGRSLPPASSPRKGRVGHSRLASCARHQAFRDIVVRLLH
jgi:hypothetical protein